MRKLILAGFCLLQLILFNKGFPDDEFYIDFYELGKESAKNKYYTIKSLANESISQFIQTFEKQNNFKMMSCDGSQKILKTIQSYITNPKASIEKDVYENINGNERIAAEIVLDNLNEIEKLIAKESYDLAMIKLGVSIRCILSFYSHTTFVELAQYNGNIDSLSLSSGTILTKLAPNSSQEKFCISSCKGDLCLTNVNTNVNYISSGYKRNTQNKCMLGGGLYDEGPNGINKDTPFQKLSPHYHLHVKAAQYALKDSNVYLNSLFQAVIDSNNKEKLLNFLGMKSCFKTLIAVIDMSGSMSDEIDAVKKLVSDLIKNRNKNDDIVIESYVDTSYWIKHTSSAKEALAFVSRIKIFGGTEKHYTALEKIIPLARSGSRIYHFTDEPGDDPENRDRVTQQLKEKNLEYTLYWTGPPENNNRKRKRSTNQNTNDLLLLAKKTGGDLVITNDANVEQSVKKILYEYSSNLIRLVSISVSEQNTLRFSTDFTIQSLYFTFSMKGISIDINRVFPQSLIGDSNLEVVTDTSTDAYLVFRNVTFGSYNINLLSSISTIKIEGNSEYFYLFEFQKRNGVELEDIFDKDRIVQGAALYLKTELIGRKSGLDHTFKYISFQDTSGNVISKYTVKQINLDVAYTLVSIPYVPFVILVHSFIKWNKLKSDMQRQSSDTFYPKSLTISNNFDYNIDLREGSKYRFNVKIMNASTDVNILIKSKTKPSNENVKLNYSPQSKTVIPYKDSSMSLPITIEIKKAVESFTGTLYINAKSGSQEDSTTVSFFIFSKYTDTSPPSCNVSFINLNQVCANFFTEAICSTKQMTANLSLEDDKGLSLLTLQKNGAFGGKLEKQSLSSAKVITKIVVDCCYESYNFHVTDTSGNIKICPSLSRPSYNLLEFEIIQELSSEMLYLRIVKYSNISFNITVEMESNVPFSYNLHDKNKGNEKKSHTLKIPLILNEIYIKVFFDFASDGPTEVLFYGKVFPTLTQFKAIKFSKSFRKPKSDDYNIIRLIVIGTFATLGLAVFFMMCFLKFRRVLFVNSIRILRENLDLTSFS